MQEVSEDTLAARISDAFPDADVQVALDGNRAQIDVVSPVFANMSRVKRQQAVYALIEEEIAAGTLHAVTIRATPPAAS